MRLGTLLLVASVLGAVYGIGFVVVTGPLLSLYGVTLDQAGTFMPNCSGFRSSVSQGWTGWLGM
jgi:hypothetical protein